MLSNATGNFDFDVRQFQNVASIVNSNKVAYDVAKSTLLVKVLQRSSQP